MPIESNLKNRFSWLRSRPNFRSALSLGIAALSLVGPAAAQTINAIYNFPGGNLGGPVYVTLAQSRAGGLYGTTYGVDSSLGSIYSVSTTGKAHFLTAFDGTNGANPLGGVTLGADGNFYGVTYMGGSANLGVLFKITPSAAYTVLHEFAGGTDGGLPFEPPVQASDGALYGTTSQNSTVYKYSPSEGYSTIYQFDQAHGQEVLASLIQGTDGRLYGVAKSGGAYNCGTIFKLTMSGTLLWYHSFLCGGGGSYPTTPLVQAADGTFYGTTTQGGNQNNDGTIFKFNQRGVSIVHRFSGGASGAGPLGLMRATDGALYGIAGGGSLNEGVLFQLTISRGTYTVLDSFASETTGGNPAAAPVQDTDGHLYGTTSDGGTNGFGTVYSVDLGVGPFIALVQYISDTGRTVQILGQGLTGATSVTFNGVPAASFSIISDTYMTVVVPVGATTGPVVVTTPTGTGTLDSNRSLVIKGS